MYIHTYTCMQYIQQNRWGVPHWMQQGLGLAPECCGVGSFGPWPSSLLALTPDLRPWVPEMDFFLAAISSLSSTYTSAINSFSCRFSLRCWGSTRSIEQNNLRSSSVLCCHGNCFRTILPTARAIESAVSCFGSLLHSLLAWVGLFSGLASSTSPLSSLLPSSVCDTPAEFIADREHPRWYSRAMRRPRKSCYMQRQSHICKIIKNTVSVTNYYILSIVTTDLVTVQDITYSDVNTSVISGIFNSITYGWVKIQFFVNIHVLHRDTSLLTQLGVTIDWTACSMDLLLHGHKQCMYV